ncbi:hypothetical protein EUX98_g1055 [Antrodiella citrinella]|uniref:F-box domain-containing protein n=1 Tax=Antrodiella citrinella TaxID=2447956 RepID=A0A4S4N2F3_9APHY|nr:hypothetical protein EUX98_g1055 [Antrodiella citrinella]
MADRKDPSTIANGELEMTAPTGRRVRGKRGSLKDLPDAPLDILFEVFTLLTPTDLLNLARTSKAFRGLMMSRKSIFLWKAARGNVEGLPECPSFLTEPAYANLAFFNHCHRCLKTARNITWEFQARYCAKCKPSMSIKEDDIHMPDGCISDETYSKHRILTFIFNVVNRSGTYYPFHYAHKPQVKNLQETWDKTPSNERNELVKVWLARADETRKFVGEASIWEQKTKTSREAKSQSHKADLECIRMARFDGVVEKLKLLGYRDELHLNEDALMDDLKHYPIVKIAKPLTEKGWSRIREEIVAFVESQKLARIRHERKQLLNRRFKVLQKNWNVDLEAAPAPFPHPHVRELISFPEVRAILDVPDDAKISATDLQVAKSLLPNITQRWLEERRECFRNIVREKIPIDEHVDPLSLAILVHNCGFNLRTHKFGASEDPYEEAANWSFGTVPWTVAAPTLLRGYKRSIKIASELIEAYGRDPARVTPEEIDTWKVTAACTQPECNVRVRVEGSWMMNWRDSIEHLLRTWSYEKDNNGPDRYTIVLVKQPNFRREHTTNGCHLEVVRAKKSSRC